MEAGESGNPSGRVAGVERVRQLLDPHRVQLVGKAVELALSGDTTALRICMDRIAPLPRADSPLVTLPGIALADTLSKKARAILDAAGAAVISPDTAVLLLGAIASAVRIIESDELSKRIAQLERQH